MKISSTFTGFEPLDDSFLIHTNGADIKLYFLTPEIIRIRASFDKNFDEESYVLSTTAWEDRLDDIFQGERTRIEPLIPDIQENDEEISLNTSAVTLKIKKKPFCIQLYDTDGTLLYSDISGFTFIQDSNNRRLHYTKIARDDCFYGFGEKGGRLNKAKKYMRMSGKDAMAWDPVDCDPLYKHIPFYIKLNASNGKALGMFYHNTYECAFCMGGEVSSLDRNYSYFQTDGGDIDLFLIAGKKISNILDNYTMLTGRPAMMPKKALGYQGSGMLYSEQPKNCEDFVMRFIQTVQEENYPIDGFYLSSGYTAQQENKRCVFTWNKDRYENPERFVKRLKESGAPVIPNIKPGVLLCHPLFDEMDAQNVFIQNSEETGNAVGYWWGGDGVFWDFTNPNARKVWKQYLKSSLLDIGIDAIWNDNCEHDGLMDTDSICDFDGKKGTIGQLRPVMPNLMSKLSREAIAEYDENIRPYILTRGGFSGIQKYAQTWCGDTVTSWDTLRYNIATILGMSMSGVPNYGTDIGGFTGPAPDAELLVRWIQSGIFQPRFCIHSANWDFTVTEPWMYPAVNDIVREAFLFRYKLTPYLYTAEYQAHLSGEPIMRPLIYDFQSDPNCCNEDINYMFGHDLLVANVVEKGAASKTVYLPKGTRWFDFYTYQCYEGGQTIEIPVSLDSIPLFLRESAIIPVAENKIMNMARDSVTDLRLIISPEGTRSYTLYDDDGETNDFRKGVFHKTTFEVTGGTKTVIRAAKEGSYQDTIQHIQMEILNPRSCPFWVCMNGTLMPQHLSRTSFKTEESGWFYDAERRAVLIKFPNPADDYEFTISWEMTNVFGI